MTIKVKAFTMTGTAALSLATALACCVVGTGCSGSDNSVDGGSGSGATSGGSGIGSGAMSGGSGAGSGAMSGGSGIGSGATSGGSGAMSGSSGMGSSGMASLPPCPTPTFAPASGAIAAGSNVVISAAGLPAGGQILFTTDGTMPSRTSPVYNAGAVGVQVTVGETIEAISTTMGATCTDSAVAMATYTIMAPAMDGGGAPSTPTFSPGATATTQSNDFQVSLTSTGSTICYTLGATAPTCTSNATAATCGTGSSTFAAPISVNATTTAASAMPGQIQIQAIACAPGQPNSAVAQALYTLQAATPAMTPAPGAQTWSPTLMGALTSATMGATINYTSNGTAPSCTTPVAGQQTYAAPFALQAGSYQAIACKAGYLASAVAGPFAFTVTLTPPTVTPAAGTFASSPTFTVSNAANPTTSWVCYSTSTTAPACGAAGVCSAGTLLPASGTFTGATNGGSVQVIACAPANLTSSTVNSQGPYKLQLAAPVILPDATTAPAASYTLPAVDGTHLAHLNISQAAVATTADQAGGHMCWLRDPGVGIAPACGTTAAAPCLNGSIQVTGNGPTDIEPMGPFGAGDSVAVITCPGTTAATGMGFAGSTVSTTVFVGQGQAMPPTIAATDTSATQPISDTANPWFSKVNAVLTNPNAAAMTVCYTTDGTAPVCTPGSTAAGCATVDGTSSQNLNFKITAGGVGYVNPPTVVLTPNNCTGGTIATLTAGAVTSITATGCSGYTTPPSVVLHTGSGAAAGGTAFETVTFIVSVGGAGYTSTPTVILTPGDGVGSCVTTTATRTGNAVTAITATGCTFDEDPTVSFTGGGGTGAVATAHVTQTVTFSAAQITGGSNYTANPAITALTPANGKGGTCTAITAAETGGVVTGVTATGCSGFSDFVDAVPGHIVATFASQGPVDGTANAAAAIAVPGNSISVPAIENNPTTLRTLACNAGLVAAPIVSATYTTQLQDPTIVATDTLTGVPVPVPGAGNMTITAGDTLTIATTSNFTDTTLVYTIDGTIPNCTGTGTAFTGASTTIPVPDPTVAATLDVHVIACGANQLPAVEQFRTFNIAVAAPVITSAVGTMALGSPGTDSASTVNIRAQNVVTATIKSPTPGSYICYSTDGTTVPTCGAAGAAPACPGPPVLINAVTGNVPVNTSGVGIIAIGCKNGKASAPTGPVVYTLEVTPAAVIGTPTAACPSVVTVGFDMAAANTSVGGPTPAGNICYSPVPIAAGAACATAGGGFAGGGVTCFTPTAAAPTRAVNENESGNIYTLACKANFTGTRVTLPVTVTPYAPPTITVDGVLNAAEWSAALGDQFATSSGGATRGGFTFGKTTTAGDTLFFSQSGFTAAAGTSVILYVRDNVTATNATTTTARLHGGAALPFRAAYAIEIDTQSAAGCAAGTCIITTFNNAGGNTAATWAAVAPAPVVSAVVTAGALEASILISALAGTATGDDFEVAGEVNTMAPTHTGLWSVGATVPPGYSSASCSTPAQSSLP